MNTIKFSAVKPYGHKFEIISEEGTKAHQAAVVNRLEYARLIAAAPDLLATLEQIAYSDFSAEVARAKARHAIAKATSSD